MPNSRYISLLINVRSVESAIYCNLLKIYWITDESCPQAERTFDPRNFTPSLPSDHFARGWILSMIKHQEEERIALPEVLQQLTPLLTVTLT